MEQKETRKKQKDGLSYSLEFKKRVISEYLATGVSKMSLLKKYNIKYKSGIQKWMQQMDIEDIWIKKPPLSNHFTPVNLPVKESIETEESSINESTSKKRIKELEKQLEEEKLRCQIYLKTIEIAEKEFKIQIRKKLSTK